MTDLVEIVGDEPSGLAQMMAALAEASLSGHPGRAKLLDEPGVVRVTATDAGVVVALELGGGRLRVHCGPGPRPDVTLSAGSADLTAFSTVPVLGPIPSPLHPAGRSMLVKLLTRKVRFGGSPLKLGLLGKIAALLAVD